MICLLQFFCICCFEVAFEHPTDFFPVLCFIVALLFTTLLKRKIQNFHKSTFWSCKLLFCDRISYRLWKDAFVFMVGRFQIWWRCIFFFIYCTQYFTNMQRYKSTSYLNGYEQYLMIFFFEYFSWKCKIKLPARAKRSQALHTWTKYMENQGKNYLALMS